MKEAVDIRTIGIPRALLYHKYGVLWERFLEELGFEVMVSPSTDRALFEEGEHHSVDECCLASKVYLGHAAALLDESDALFVPCYDSCNVRASFCTKYQSLPDLVRATFRDEAPRIVSLHIGDASDKKRTKKAFIDLGTRLGASPKRAARAWRRAFRAQESHDARQAASQGETLKLTAKLKALMEKDPTGCEAAPLTILLVAHPYIAHDEFVAGDIVKSLERMNAVVIFADESDPHQTFKRSFEFSETLPWAINRQLIGSILTLKDEVDGIVLLSAFPCGPDSMFDDAIMRNIHGIPILNLMIDAQSGSAGVETRIESFMDILRFKERGSYLD